MSLPPTSSSAPEPRATEIRGSDSPSNKALVTKKDLAVSLVAALIFGALGAALFAASIATMATGFGSVVTVPLAIASAVSFTVCSGLFFYLAYKTEKYRQQTQLINILLSMRLLTEASSLFHTETSSL